MSISLNRLKNVIARWAIKGTSHMLRHMGSRFNIAFAILKVHPICLSIWDLGLILHSQY